VVEALEANDQQLPRSRPLAPQDEGAVLGRHVVGTARGLPVDGLLTLVSVNERSAVGLEDDETVARSERTGCPSLVVDATPAEQRHHGLPFEPGGDERACLLGRRVIPGPRAVTHATR